MSDISLFAKQRFEGYAPEQVFRPDVQYESYARQDLIEELCGLGVSAEKLDQLSIPSLATLLTVLTQHFTSTQVRRRPGRPRGSASSKNVSPVDKKILKSLLSSQGGVSSLILSKELGIPLSTIQRRRKRLEMYLLDKSYTLKVDKFGLRTADLFISTKNGMMSMVATELLKLQDAVMSVNRTLGESAIDIKAEIVFRDNEHLAEIIAHVNSIEGVNKVYWNEKVKQIGKNDRPLSYIIDSM